MPDRTRKTHGNITRGSATKTKHPARTGKRGVVKSLEQQRARSTAFASVGADPSTANLSKIDHIVVLMMENRSFDHMLGYLKLEDGRNDIDGLTQGLSNSYNGKAFEIYHLSQTALGDNQDPCHEGTCVAEQLSGNNSGFVKNYATTHPDDSNPGLVMGYYNRLDLPVFSHLAAEFCVCNRWFASVPGATWPNRLYALAGRANGSKNNKRMPWYNLPSFVRHLDESKVSWRWYAFESAAGVIATTLRLADSTYRFSGEHAKFDPDFISDAAAGRLPAVSWIDPNFVDFGDPVGANDDHPPADITAGQELVLKVYHAVSRSPQWSKTLLIVVYDEHGGFYDHVGPPPNAQDDDPQFRNYGVRVPAIVVSPRVARQSVANTVYDHTSIIKTILLRFCCRSDGSIPHMGARVMAANHLGVLLTEQMPRQPPDMGSYETASDHIAAWHGRSFKARLRAFGLEAQRPARKLSDFQRGLLEASKRLAKEKTK